MKRRTLLQALPLTLFARARTDLWELANTNRASHRFSTLFTAQDVRDRLSTSAGLGSAIGWCKNTAVTKVYIEEFRDAYRADRRAIESAKDRFKQEGIETSGCVTTTQVGKRSTGWDPISCFTDRATQESLKSIFEYAASLFDEVMIDDFWFTDCECAECDRARRVKQVEIGGQQFPVHGDTWGEYRGELMFQLSRLYVLEAARKVNPRVRLIIKYPQWYDRFHERGYDVARETEIFDRIWVGTETRDRETKGAQPYEAYFIMRWLGGIGGPKTGGGWYDPYDTHEATYLEQARQTVLAGARESMLFCYGSLQEKTGPANINVLRPAIPELLETARQVQKREPVGIAAYKPPNSRPEGDSFIFDSIGMLGLPLLPCHTFPAEAPAAFFSLHALSDPEFESALARYVATGRPVLVTDELAARLKPSAPNVHTVTGDLNTLRAAMLRPFEVTLRGPAETGCYLFKDRSWVLENFSNRESTLELNGRKHRLPPRAWLQHWT